MILGVTGTQHSATSYQIALMQSMVRHPSVTEVHHGDCIGVDELAHEVALATGKLIVVHPPDNPKKRAFCTGLPCDCAGPFPTGHAHEPRCSALQVTILDPLPYAERNLAIVQAIQFLIAVPRGSEISLPRSGTWMTVRYARQLVGYSNIRIIMPRMIEEVR